MPFQMIRDDITTMKVDAIVNAANRSLLGGGGVDGAIHRAAGPELLEECRTLGGCETGQAKITKGYNLPARYVIHTVGPIWHGGEYGEKELLMSCYRSSLELAAAHDCETVAFPLISAGAYGYPKDQAMAVAVEVITRFLFDHDMTVWLVLFGSTEFLTGKKLFRDIQEYIDDEYAASHVRPNVESARKKLWHEDEDAALDLDMELSEAKPRSEKKSGPLSGLARHILSGSRPASGILPSAAQPRPDWEEMVKRTDESFSEALLRLIDEKGMTDVECYKKANVDRRLFSKIRSNPAYCPGKSTVFAFAIALQLTLPETRELLGKAGYSFSRSRKMDIIIEYFIRHRIYNIWEINEVLFQLDLPLLGSNIG